MNRNRSYPDLKTWRGRRNQEDAARELGISQGYYSRLEQGTQHPYRLLAKRISDKTGVPLETLLGIA